MNAVVPSETSADFNKFTRRNALHDSCDHLLLVCYTFSKDKAIKSNSFAGDTFFSWQGIHGVVGTSDT